jgi:hypothetical protein
MVSSNDGKDVPHCTSESWLQLWITSSMVFIAMLESEARKDFFSISAVIW